MTAVSSAQTARGGRRKEHAAAWQTIRLETQAELVDLVVAILTTRVDRPLLAALVMQAWLAVGPILLVLALVMQAGLAGWADPPNHMLGKARRIMLGKALGAHLEQFL